MLDGDLAWALATALHFEWEDSERELLAPLINATIMRAEQERLDQIARRIVEALWEEVGPLVAGELRDQERTDDFVAQALGAALADLELGAASRLVAYVLQQAALDLADHAFFLEECLDCIEEGLAHATPQAQAALVERAVAALALHSAAQFGPSPTDAERRAARKHIGEMAALGSDSLPLLSRALAELGAEPLPPPSQDSVLRAVINRRAAGVAGLN